MRLDENPILNTHSTLARRYGLRPAMWAIALLTGITCWAYVEDMQQTRNWTTNLTRLAGEYVLSITIMQFIVGLLGAVGVARALSVRRKDGALDADRLTPMTPSDLAAGYWLGPLLAPAIVMAFGTITIFFIALVTPQVPMQQIIASQSIVYSTLVTIGIVGLWVGLEVRNPSLAPGLMLGALLLSPFTLAFGEVFVGHAFFGFYGFFGLSFGGNLYRESVDLLIDPRLLTAVVQGAAVWLAWRGVTRKLANPQVRGVNFFEAVGFAAALVCVQTAILFPELVSRWTAETYHYDTNDMLTNGYVFAGAAVFAAAFATVQSPDTVRRLLLREGRSDAAVLLKSGLSASVIVALVSAVALGFLVSAGPNGDRAITTVDLLLTSVILFSFIEGATVTGRRRQMVIALAVLALSCAAPIVMAIAIDDDFAMAIPGISGILAYTGEMRSHDEMTAISLVYHAILAAGGYVFWRRAMLATCKTVRSTSL
jgi:hypothetical protein